MRGADEQPGSMFSYISLEERVPQDHPLRTIRRITDRALERLSSRFGTLYINFGRPSIPPEKLFRALLLQAFYTIRSERQLMEQLAYNLLFRWFVGLGMDDLVWNPTTFTKNRDRLPNGGGAWGFFQAVVDQARSHGLLSEEHFTVDGTLIDAWASHKSFVPKDGKGPKSGDGSRNADVDFRGQKRSNETHQSVTDPESRLFRKSRGTESKLCYAAHVLMDNRHGLAVEGCVTTATSSAEREAALWMTAHLPGRATLGADKGYDVRSFAGELRRRGITPHLAEKNASYSTIDGRTTRHEGYAISQKKRKLVEQIFGWTKTVAVLRKTRHRGRERVDWMFVFALAAYNLIRIRNLTWSPA